MWTAPWSSTSSPLTSRLSQSGSLSFVQSNPGVSSEDDLLLPVGQGAISENKTWTESLPIYAWGGVEEGGWRNNLFVQALRLEWLDDSESYFGDVNSKLSIFEHTVDLQQVRDFLKMGPTDLFDHLDSCLVLW